MQATISPLSPIEAEALRTLLVWMAADGFHEGAAAIVVTKDAASGPGWAWRAVSEAALIFATIERSRLMAGLQTRIAKLVDKLPAEPLAAAVSVSPRKQASLFD